MYDQELLKKIRENAYAYFHGHTVGGTNPSLIEALGSTDLNLLVDVFLIGKWLKTVHCIGVAMMGIWQN